MLERVDGVGFGRRFWATVCGSVRCNLVQSLGFGCNLLDFVAVALLVVGAFIAAGGDGFEGESLNLSNVTRGKVLQKAGGKAGDRCPVPSKQKNSV